MTRLPNKIAILQKAIPKHGGWYDRYRYLKDVPQFFVDFIYYDRHCTKWIWYTFDREWHDTMKSNVRELVQLILAAIPSIDKGYTSDTAPSLHMQELTSRANKYLSGEVLLTEVVDKWAAMCVLEAYVERTKWVRFGRERHRMQPSLTYTSFEPVTRTVVSSGGYVYQYTEQGHVTRRNANYESQMRDYNTKVCDIPKADHLPSNIISFTLCGASYGEVDHGVWHARYLEKEGKKPTKRQLEVDDTRSCHYENLGLERRVVTHVAGADRGCS